MPTPDSTDKHRRMLRVLQAACSSQETLDIVLCSEWLGYLPFGLYCWVEVGGEADVDREFPTPWDTGDFDAMESAGSIVRVCHEVTSPDGLDTRTTYRLATGGRDTAR